MLNMAHVLMV